MQYARFADLSIIQEVIFVRDVEWIKRVIRMVRMDKAVSLDLAIKRRGLMSPVDQMGREQDPGLPSRIRTKEDSINMDMVIRRAEDRSVILRKTLCRRAEDRSLILINMLCRRAKVRSTILKNMRARGQATISRNMQIMQEHLGSAGTWY